VWAYHPLIVRNGRYSSTTNNTPLPLRRVRALALRATHCVGSVTDETLWEMSNPPNPGNTVKISLGNYHGEVLDALKEVSEPGRAEATKIDRRSSLDFLGVRAPALRQVVKKGFSFYAQPEAQILQIWDEIWSNSTYSEVMNAAIDYYGHKTKKQVDPNLWPVIKHWSNRVENWAHADGLGGIYSRVLEQYPDPVYEQLQLWNTAPNQWLRRISLVSLIHYTGKNAVFLPPDQVLPLVDNCLSDDRHYVQKALGWVLREMGHVYPNEIRVYIEKSISMLSSIAFSRAIERRDASVREELRRLRKDKRSHR